MPQPVVYLDTCSLNRLTDDLGQPRLFAEAGAMTAIFSLIRRNEVRWVASTLLVYEISRNPDPYKRAFASSLLPPESELVIPTSLTIARSVELRQHGITPADALHLALAEQAGADWLLTTDDRLIRRASTRNEPPECVNPVDWLRRRQPWLVPKS